MATTCGQLGCRARAAGVAGGAEGGSRGARSSRRVDAAEGTKPINHGDVGLEQVTLRLTRRPVDPVAAMWPAFIHGANHAARTAGGCYGPLTNGSVNCSLCRNPRYPCYSSCFTPPPPLHSKSRAAGGGALRHGQLRRHRPHADKSRPMRGRTIDLRPERNRVYSPVPSNGHAQHRSLARRPCWWCG